MRLIVLENLICNKKLIEKRIRNDIDVFCDIMVVVFFEIKDLCYFYMLRWLF